jgi:hypothetical protein
MKARVAPLLAMFKEGIYPAVVERLEVQNGQFGEYLRWNFMAPTAKGEAITVTGLTSTIFNPKSKMYSWASAVKGKQFDVHEELDTDTLHNQRCRVYLTVEEVDGGESINQIEKVLPPENVVEDDDNPFA